MRPAGVSPMLMSMKTMGRVVEDDVEEDIIQVCSAMIQKTVWLLSKVVVDCQVTEGVRNPSRKVRTALSK